MKAYKKDIFKSIWKGKKRFCAILLITALGVCMLTALKASCDDLRYSADQFFDEQNLMDIKIVSTLGLTQEDVRAVAAIDGIEDAEGTYSQTVYTQVKEQTKQVTLNVLSEKGINVPYLLEGRMPEAADEILVTRDYISDTGYEVGDRLVISESVKEKDEATEEDTEIEETEAETEDEAAGKIIIKEYRICGIVIDACDINSNEGAISFRANSTTDYTFFVRSDAVEYRVFTAIYLTVADTDAFLCYSKDYEERIDFFVDILEDRIKEDREKARYDEIIGDAEDKIEDAEKELDEKLGEAEKELKDAMDKLAEIKAELTSGEAELISGEKELEKAKKELEAAERKLKLAELQLEEAKAEIDANEKELTAGEAELIAGEAQIEETQKQLKAAQAELEAAEKELNEAEAEAKEQFESLRSLITIPMASILENYEKTGAEITELKTEISALENEKAILEAKQNEGSLTTSEMLRLLEIRFELPAKETSLSTKERELTSLKTQKETCEKALSELEIKEEETNAQIADGRAQIEENRLKLEDGKKQLEDGRQELEKNKELLASGRKQLEEGKAEYEAAKKGIVTGWQELDTGWLQWEASKEALADGREEMESGKEEVEKGESELLENVSKFEDEKAKAEQEIANARKELENIKMTEWYISTRTSLSGYNNIKTDADCIEAIGNAFPILFLTVAILVSLTTISRMVEEDRGLIGTYKALGFTNREIQRKYVIYALLASLLGGLLGLFLGFVVLPNILFVIFGVMYQIETYILKFNFLYGIGGILLFAAGILASAILSCRNELRKMPATLMRPKAPKNGSRVFLERFPSVWSRLSFLNKVTVRNLFRYKKRLFMTLFGIAGCTALIVAGFTIKDTVTKLMENQYGNVYIYDAMVVAEDGETIHKYLDEDSDVRSYLNLHISNVKIFNEDGKGESLQIMVIPEDGSLRGYISLKNMEGENIRLEDGDVYVTINAMNQIGVTIGDLITLQTMQLEEAAVEVTDAVKNYVGNCVYMTEATYRQLYGAYENNAALVRLKIGEEYHDAWGEELGKQDGILTASTSAGFEDAADTVFRILNMVVYLIIVLAAALAFVVLFTLATTNISERERELATIKVLGFFDPEVHAYVNKETLILTGIGIVLGLPFGKFLGDWLMSILNMPSIYFAPYTEPISFLYSVGLAICFALLVNLITDRSLNRIDPVEALKSIE